MGLLRPEQEWTERVPRSSVHTIMAVVWFLLAGTGCVLMVIGDGGTMTWIGLVCFTIALGGFVHLNIRSVRADGVS
jgi:membrane protein implicated in regulation of membrane protease activity